MFGARDHGDEAEIMHRPADARHPDLRADRRRTRTPEGRIRISAEVFRNHSGGIAYRELMDTLAITQRARFAGPGRWDPDRLAGCP